MTTFIKAKLKNTNNQTNIRVATNISEYQTISKLILPRINHSKILDNKASILQKKTYLKWKYRIFGHNYVFFNSLKKTFWVIFINLAN